MRLIKKINRNDILHTLIIIYAVSIICCNFFSVKPLSFSFPFIIMDGGLLISWVPLFISNIINEAYGKDIVKSIVFSTTIVSICVSILAVIISFIPTLPIYEEQSIHFSYVFSNSIRIIIASHFSFFVSNYLHINILNNLKNKVKVDNTLNYLWRTFIAAFFAQLIDNMMFETLAFAKVGLTPYEMGIFDIFTSGISSTIIELIFHMLFISVLAKNIIKIVSKPE